MSAIATETQTTTDEPTAGASTWRARVRGILEGPPGQSADEISAYTPPSLPDPHWMGPVRRNVMLVASAASGFLGSLLIVATAPVWHLARGGSWRLTLPGIPHPGSSSLFAGTTFVVGVILMTLGWIGLIGRAERQRGSERRRLVMVVSVLALWVVPLLLAPPLLSNDAYSYVAQGELAGRGIDPTSHGPVYLLQDDNLMSPADPVWRNSPAPYGPVWIGLSRTVLEVTGHDSPSSLWGFRGLAVIGVAMSAVGIALIARSYRLSPASAIALGIANPLVLLHLIGGSHNDALMLGFLALGLAAFRRDKRVLTVVLVALAVAVKLPAAVALIYIGWAWAGKGAPVKARIGSVARTMAGAIAIVASLCLLVGIGAGWLIALQGTNSITSTFSTTTKLGYVLADTINLTGLGLNEDIIVGAFRLLGLAVAGLVGLALLLRSDRLGVVRCVGLALVAVILLGPVVWPWYLPAGFAILAAAGLGKWRPSYYVVSFAACLLVFPRSVNAVPSLSRWQHFLGLGVVVLIGVVAYMAPKFAAWARARRSDRLGLDPSDDADGANHQPVQSRVASPLVLTADA